MTDPSSAYCGIVKSTENSALIVGAGVIGQASAFRLARAGWKVTVLDPSPGQGATRAAAGMIAPSAEIAPGEQANYELQRRALPEWRRLNTELAEVIGREVEIFETGTLIVGWDGSDRRQVAQYAQVAQDFGVETAPMDRGADAAAFEGISGRINEGIYIGGDAWLDPDQAMELLGEANAQLGVRVIESQVLSIKSDAESVEALTGDDCHRGTLGILATGALAPPEGALTSNVNVVRPVRGMTVRVGGIDRSAQPTIRAFVHGHMFYMVSRPGGYCVLGATSDERQEPIIEVGETQRLLRDALDVVPALESASILDTRVGLRPASADLRPFFEVLGGGRWAWSSGHYRHGVTLAPLAALDAVHFAETSR
jgi:glycine oxidase